MPNDFSKLDKELTNLCKEANIPGMALIISKGDTAVFEKYYGWRDVEHKQPVTSHTIFGAASLTKSLTALAIMQLEDADKLHTSDSVKAWLPEFRLPNAPPEKNITIHHLLTHTSGLPGLPAVHAARLSSVLSDPDGSYLFDEMPENIEPISTVHELMNLIANLDFELLGTPGEVFNYSNEGFALLQAIIERASGTTYPAFVDHHIFQPLQMDRSLFKTDNLDSLDVTELYAFKKEDHSFFHSPVWWDVGEIFSNGSLKTSAVDLITYLQVFQQNNQVPDAQLISQTALEKMTTPHVTAPNGMQYGYGLQIDAMGDAEVIGHGGSIKGVSANMQCLPHDDLRGVVLINIADADAAGILKTAMQTIRGDISSEETNHPAPIELSDEQLEKFAGLYQSDEGKYADVQLQEVTLLLADNRGNTRLYPRGAYQFLTEDRQIITFLPDDNGEIIGLFIGIRHIQKVR